MNESAPITGVPPSIPGYLLPALAYKTVHVLIELQNRIDAKQQTEQAQMAGDNDDCFLEPLAYGHNYKSILSNMSRDMQLLHTAVCELVTSKLKKNYLNQVPPHALITRIFKNDVSPTAEIIQKVVTEVMERGKNTNFF